MIDNKALKQLLYQRDDICTVLDVWENEPDLDIELLKRVDLCSPHIAGYSYDGKLAGLEMMYQACCRFLSIQAEPEMGVGSDNELAIELGEQRNVIEAIREAVLSCYDLAQDDQRFRGSLLHGQQQQLAVEFDRLRKNYPVRRELSSYRIANLNELDKAVIDSLAALGFICR